MKTLPIAPAYHHRWTHHSDEGLMTEIQQQNSGAFEELYRRHHVLLHGIVMSVLRCESDAQDLLQSIFVAIWNGGSLRYLPSRGKPLGWLITISRRRAIDLVRKQTSYTRMCDGFQAEALIQSPFSSRTVEHEVDSAEYRSLVAIALARLPEAQRVAIELSFFKGLSQRDISALLGVPVGTIKTRITLAVLKVKRCLSSFSRELEDQLGNALPA
jgi:RNA polymerase sigma-70 factor (ECF subfamily)